MKRIALILILSGFFLISVASGITVADRMAQSPQAIEAVPALEKSSGADVCPREKGVCPAGGSRRGAAKLTA
jgi:hypothetical protein